MLLILIIGLSVPMCGYGILEEKVDNLVKEGRAAVFHNHGLVCTKMVHDQSSNRLFIGGMNKLYALDASSLKQLEEVDLTPSKDEQEQCMKVKPKNQPKESCQQYCMSWLQVKGDKLYTCGTKALTPICVVRSTTNIKKEITLNAKLDSKCLAPANPLAKAVYVVDNEMVYVGAILFAPLLDPRNQMPYQGGLIMSHLTDPNVKPILTVFTKGDDENVAPNVWLHLPQFVAAFQAGDFVYFVFNEVALELDANFEFRSRIGRVCKKDTGGSGVLHGKWASFTKATLSCQGYYMCDAAHFNPADSFLYVACGDQDSTNGGICMFGLSKIDEIFRGSFLYNEDPEKKPWKEVKTIVSAGALEPPAHTCFGDRPNDDALNLHLMSKPIHPACEKPIYEIKDRVFTAIYVEKAEAGSEAKNGLIAYFGDSEGRVWTFSLDGCDKSKPVSILDSVPSNIKEDESLRITELQATNDALYALTLYGVIRVGVSHTTTTTLFTGPGPQDEPGQNTDPGDNAPAEPNPDGALSGTPNETESDTVDPGWGESPEWGHKKITPPYYYPRQHNQEIVGARSMNGINNLHSAPGDVAMKITASCIMYARIRFRH